MSEEKREPLSPESAGNFIHEFVAKDIAPGGRFEDKHAHTRFPPEPNGYLHIGHAKAICIDFGTAEKFDGICNLRIDDTNPSKGDTKYADTIQEDIHWLGYDWDDRFYYASDYFEAMYQLAEGLIERGPAHICQLTPDQMRENRGDLKNPAVSPYRNRPAEESIDLFRRIRAGEFPDGTMTLRTKTDPASDNFNIRDPILYHISHTSRHRTGDAWCIHPMYDYAYPIEDTMEDTTHSLCSLEFEDHHPLYDWVIQNVGLPSKPRQVGFARPDINNTVMSKRYLRLLVERESVSGWDDPHIPTLCGLRHRGYTPASIRNSIEHLGVSKVNSTVEYTFLEHCLREDLNLNARRVMCMPDPIKLIITNYPENQVEGFKVEDDPSRPENGSCKVDFSYGVWIERDGFTETPPRGYFRLLLGNEVRLKATYTIRYTGCRKGENGSVVGVYAECDPATRGGNTPDGRRVKGTIHWVNAASAVSAEVRLYSNLFTVPDPEADEFLELLNPDSLTVLKGCRVEPDVAKASAPTSFQFMRQGYFRPGLSSTPEHPVFNRSVSLKDSFNRK